jgi:membrane protein DedA with SNARE-associated domain
VLLLGNIGVPIPEETIVGLAGYLAWRGELRFTLAIAVGILSAVAGDNLGYYPGRKYGKAAIERYAAALMTLQRVEWAERFVQRYGLFGIFLARFVPVARFMAGRSPGP